jgi:hypothetical protein
MASALIERALRSVRKTPTLLNAILRNVSQEQAQQLTDGPDGWNTVETMCHMHDFEVLARTRVDLMLSQDDPELPGITNPPELAARRDYKAQRLADEFAGWLEKRRVLMTLLTETPEEKWVRFGHSPVWGVMNLTQAVDHIALHDINHIEQIARILGRSDALVK